MTEKYKPSHIANYFLRKGEEESHAITQMKLLKLVYIAYGWSLALLDKPLFDEKIEAWKHGPVIRSIYNEFKHLGKEPIDVYATEFDLDNQVLTQPEVAKDQETLLLVLDKVWNLYKSFDAWALRNKTHEEGTPWKMTVDINGLGGTIDDELISAHFKERIKDYISASKSR